jgi:hypothetical protein
MARNNSANGQEWREVSLLDPNTTIIRPKNSQKVISKINLNITWVRVKQIIAAHENILIDEFALFLNFPPINIVAMAKSLTELELKQCKTNKLL